MAKRKKGQKNPSDRTLSSKTLIQEVLERRSDVPMLSVPEGNTVFPVDSFPPLSTFDVTMTFPALVVPAAETASMRTRFRSILICYRKISNVAKLESDDLVPTGSKTDKYRKLILNDSFKISEHEEITELIAKRDFWLSSHEINLGYDDWSADEVFKKLLPLAEAPSSFEGVGHIAHLNLRDEQLPFKYIIGKVLMDKNGPRIRTVVNKVGAIETEYRTFGMEVIAGDSKEGWSRVTVKEERCQYELDFREVYWNSRLSGEHRRLVRAVVKSRNTYPDETLTVVDLMAGIGPFAIPLTTCGEDICVYANDLNPASFRYLQKNAELNKAKSLNCFNMDARAFSHYVQDQQIKFRHVIMNLPASAPEFLDSFRGFSGPVLPRIHVHCFAGKEGRESEKEAIHRCAVALGCDILDDLHDVHVHMVRDVSPKKYMYCVSFNLPDEARSLDRIPLVENRSSTKRQKTAPCHLKILPDEVSITMS